MSGGRRPCSAAHSVGPSAFQRGGLQLGSPHPSPAGCSPGPHAHPYTGTGPWGPLGTWCSPRAWGAPGSSGVCFVQVEATQKENLQLRSRCEALHAKNLEMG